VKAEWMRSEQGGAMSDTEKALKLLEQQTGSLKGGPKEISKEEIWKEFTKELPR